MLHPIPTNRESTMRKTITKTLLPLKPKLFRDVIEAARLRALRVSWEAISARFGRNHLTMRGWQRKYRELWRVALEKARRAAAAEGVIDPNVILRVLANSATEGMQEEVRRLTEEMNAPAGPAGKNAGPPGGPFPKSAAHVAQDDKEINDAELPAEIERLEKLYRGMQKSMGIEDPASGSASAG